MGTTDEPGTAFAQEDHSLAYVLDADEDESRRQRPTKRRKVSRQTKRSAPQPEETYFVPLLNGAEKPECVRLRQRLFEEGWGRVEWRIQEILREANSSTLEQVSAFAVAAGGTEYTDQIPSAFIITGPNIASQDLLFEQLSETLQRSSNSKFVSLRSSETTTLKAALKKTIRDATSSDAGDAEEVQVRSARQHRRRYLDYDLEALEASLKHETCEHVFVAFQDSEGFDSGLISDLISLFHSWRSRIPFTLLFGIATSVDLFQARLLKSACRLVYGAQFDCVQTETILETVFKGAVAASDVPLRLGGSLLRSMLERQHTQMAGIQAFISSLKYAYMCHFYANALSILDSPDGLAGDILQAEHVEALRNLESFRQLVQRAVELGTDESTAHARRLIEDDAYLVSQVDEIGQRRQRWVGSVLRTVLGLEAAGQQQNKTFPEAYADAVSGGGGLAEQPGLMDRIRRSSADELSAMIGRIVAVLEQGDDRLALEPWTDGEGVEARRTLERLLAEVEELLAVARTGGFTLRSRYSGQSKVMRTTVIAQRVQLSQDSAALRDEDRRLTEVVDEVVGLLKAVLADDGPETVVFSECWLYDSRRPLRDVLVPRPRAVFERSLGRPQDYLGEAPVPATCLLYRLYLETGSLINVADLWTAFEAMAGRPKGGEDGARQGKQQTKNKNKDNKDNKGAGEDDDEGEAGDKERETLALFYRGLAELRAMGFVKATKRKTDHVAKVRWL
ncbi:hypothetical protein XA68_10856 [Ophiocordyceps unilateralis]|uniref:Origin recognition complex subunit 3 winged helix C-terminal domain-containing protein n=1 Tax=Ophiocordyceps unilateralis TaxID=268505 RepID=A0A2A9PHZ4_OPHUN|nr:hypothetical protein XA68_10856 [Ophiocordyceps unilateralis]